MKLFCLFIIVVLICPGWSDASEVLTFERAVALALKSNHQIGIARNNESIAHNQVNVGNAGLLPQLSLNGSMTYQDEGDNQTSSGNHTLAKGQIQGSYTLFSGLANIYRFRKLKITGNLGTLEARHSIELTLIKISTAFYQAASAYENLQIASELLKISQERLDRAKKRAAYGRARTIDVLSAQVDYITDQVTLTQAEFAWRESRRQLNVLLNRQVDYPFLIDTKVDFHREFDLKNLQIVALSRNASYLAAIERVGQTKQDLKIIKASQLPQLNLTATYGYAQINSGLDLGLSELNDSLALGAQLSFNLFNGFQTQVQKANTRIRVNSQTLLLQEAKLQLEREVISAFESYENSLLILDLENKHLEAAQLNFKRMQELYNLGQVTTTQFREAQLNLIQARSNVSAAKYQARLKEIELLRLSGQLLD